MTANQIINKLRKANFDMSAVVDASKNYLEVFSGDALDPDKNVELAKQAAEITGLNNICNIAYGGYMLSSESFSIDSENRL